MQIFLIAEKAYFNIKNQRNSLCKYLTLFIGNILILWNHLHKIITLN